MDLRPAPSAPARQGRRSPSSCTSNPSPARSASPDGRPIIAATPATPFSGLLRRRRLRPAPAPARQLDLDPPTGLRLIRRLSLHCLRRLCRHRHQREPHCRSQQRSCLLAPSVVDQAARDVVPVRYLRHRASWRRRFRQDRLLLLRSVAPTTRHRPRRYRTAVTDSRDTCLFRSAHSAMTAPSSRRLKAVLAGRLR
jgi:hypothetical protein